MVMAACDVNDDATVLKAKLAREIFWKSLQTNIIHKQQVSE